MEPAQLCLENGETTPRALLDGGSREAGPDGVWSACMLRLHARMMEDFARCGIQTMGAERDDPLLMGLYIRIRM